MITCELVRTVKCGRLTIRLWIDANGGQCDMLRSHADTVAMLVAEMADEDDDEMELEERIASVFSRISAVEVVDDDGDGGRFRFEVNRRSCCDDAD